jgi:hypothetical protein
MKDKLKLNTEKQPYHFTSFVIRQHRIEWKKRKKQVRFLLKDKPVKVKIYSPTSLISIKQ